MTDRNRGPALEIQTEDGKWFIAYAGNKIAVQGRELFDSREELLKVAKTHKFDIDGRELSLILL